MMNTARLHIRGLEVLHRDSGGGLVLLAYHPRSSSTWHWSIGVRKVGGTPHRAAYRTGQWHDYYWLPFEAISEVKIDAPADLRDLVSYQILTVVFLALTVVGAALFLAASVAKVLRLWLVRQLLEGQAQTDQISQALSTRN